MIITFILTVSSLIYAIICIGKVEIEPPSTFLLTNILFIVNIILYITAVSLWTGNTAYVSSDYSSGLITALIAFIIFSILFIFKSIFHKEIKPKEKIKSENEAMNILKSRYAKGEITKEEYEQNKKRFRIVLREKIIIDNRLPKINKNNSPM